MRFFSCSSFNAASFVWKAGTNGSVRRLEAVLVVSAATSMRLPFSAQAVTVCRMAMVLFSKSIASHLSPTTSLRRKP